MSNHDQLNDAIQKAMDRHTVYVLTVKAPLSRLRGVCDLNGHGEAEFMSRQECLTAIYSDKGMA